MHEILGKLPPEAVVLDLGCQRGSFDASPYPLRVIRVDLEQPSPAPANFVAASASALPFADGAIHAVVSNHSLEHFENLDACIAEIARVLAPGALIFIAIPDCSTVTDRLYRWLARGGGHVNQIADVETVPRLITAATGLPLAARRVLCTSLSFLNRRNWTGKPPRKLLLAGNGRESWLRAIVYGFRLADLWFGWRTSVYGWAYYFGDFPSVEIDTRVWSNVCIRCGSASPSQYLEQSGAVCRRRFRPTVFVCPVCRASNYFTDDARFGSLR